MGAAPAHEEAPAQGAARLPRGFWWTLGWGVLAFLAWLAVQAILLIVFLVRWSAEHPGQALDLSIVHSDAWLISLSVLLPAAVECAVLLLAARRTGWAAADYLALRWPRRGDLLLGIACTIVLMVGSDVLSWLIGRDVLPPFMTRLYQAARDSGAGPLLLTAAIIAAPLSEEMMFRGFLFRGWAASRLGVAGTILVTSALWAVIHQQYDWFGIAQVFCIGLVFGWLRWRSNSTSLTMLLHGIVNLGAAIETAVILEWLR